MVIILIVFIVHTDRTDDEAEGLTIAKLDILFEW